MAAAHATLLKISASFARIMPEAPWPGAADHGTLERDGLRQNRRMF